MIGNGIGIVQTIIGYPFDTLKTKMQNVSSNNKLFTAKSFNGLKFSIMGSMISNTLLFGNYDMIEKNALYGILFGGVSGLLITPFEAKKISNQCNTKPLSLFSGLKYTTLREMIGIPIYLKTYQSVRSFGVNEFIAGGCAGMTSCLIAFPVDTLKTRSQTNSISLNTNLFRGVGIGLVRAFIVNGISFFIYEKIKILL